MLTGEENVFTLSGLHAFNTTFFAVTFALVYLALDPLVKTFYALRCFYVDARTTGEDLASGLRALPAVSVATCRACWPWLSRPPPPMPPMLPPPPPPPPPAARVPANVDSVSTTALGRSVQDVLQSPGICLAFAASRPSRPTPAGPDPSGVSSTT